MIAGHGDSIEWLPEVGAVLFEKFITQKAWCAVRLRIHRDQVETGVSAHGAYYCRR
jgi:hypothetical protein